jgi:hypothetical protein
MAVASHGSMRALTAALMGASALFTAGCSVTTTVPAAQPDQHRPAFNAQRHTVRLVVDGTARRVSVIFSPGDGQQYGDRATSLPWSKTVTAIGGNYLYVSGAAERRGVDMTCTVYVDGKAVSTGVPEHDNSLCSASVTVQ